jgi:2-polyprenyl-3-methyl-5-hydroxy-6-metoxy-1,4-benzoquinol methylase
MFKHRSSKKELLDGEISKEDLYQNLDELHSINRLLGGYKGSLSKVIQHSDKEEITIMDIGCGGGDMLRFLYNNLRAKGTFTFIGVDLKEDCIAYAKRKHKGTPLIFQTVDYRIALKEMKAVDIVHANLFTHHLSNAEISELIDYVHSSNKVLIINDLHRSRFAYYAIWFLTGIFSKSHLVKHDARLSVLRGFKKKDWDRILARTKVDKRHVYIQWKWAFRYLVTINHEE